MSASNREVDVRAHERSDSHSFDGAVPSFLRGDGPDAAAGAGAVLAEYVILGVREGTAPVELAELAHAFLPIVSQAFRQDGEDTAPMLLDPEATRVVRTLTVRLFALQDGRRLLEVRDPATDQRSAIVAHAG